MRSVNRRITTTPPPRPKPRQDESPDGYQRQYVIVALASEMAAGAVVASQTRKPDAEESKEMVHLLDGINKELTNVMQDSVQMVRVNPDHSQTRSTCYSRGGWRMRVGPLQIAHSRPSSSFPRLYASNCWRSIVLVGRSRAQHKHHGCFLSSTLFWPSLPLTRRPVWTRGMASTPCRRRAKRCWT